MRLQNLLPVAPFAMMMAFTAPMGCGTADPTGMDPAPSNVGQATGYLDLSAAPAASRDYLEVNLNVKAIELLDARTGLWITAATPNRTINILSQTSVEALLAAQVKLAVGHYTKLRLTLGDGCALKLLDGTVRALILPVELKAGLVLDVDLNVQLGVALRAVLDLDLDSCIQLIVAQGANSYYLRPLFRVVDKAQLGIITGVVRAKVTGQVLAGALVSAQWFDAAGRPHIELTAIADINGRFTLDRLPLGRKYYVVCRPLLSGVVYDALASVELDLSAAARVAVDLDLDVAVAASAMVAGNVTPMVSLDAADKVELVEFLTCGPSCNKWFVVASAMAQVNVQENYSFAVLGQGRFAIQSSRLHCLTGLCSWDPLWVGAAVDITAGLHLNLDIGLHL